MAINFALLNFFINIIHGWFHTFYAAIIFRLFTPRRHDYREDASILYVYDAKLRYRRNTMTSDDDDDKISRYAKAQQSAASSSFNFSLIDEYTLSLIHAGHLQIYTVYASKFYCSLRIS